MYCTVNRMYSTYTWVLIKISGSGKEKLETGEGRARFYLRFLALRGQIADTDSQVKYGSYSTRNENPIKGPEGILDRSGQLWYKIIPGEKYSAWSQIAPISKSQITRTQKRLAATIILPLSVLFASHDTSQCAKDKEWFPLLLACCEQLRQEVVWFEEYPFLFGNHLLLIPVSLIANQHLPFDEDLRMILAVKRVFEIMLLDVLNKSLNEAVPKK